MSPSDSLSSGFEETARRIEADLRRLIATLNDELVPRLRQDGGRALHCAADKLHQLAEILDRAH
ncbi:MAG: hypothetical protein ACRD1C_11260 [Terriglobales bacterium]